MKSNFIGLQGWEQFGVKVQLVVRQPLQLNANPYQAHKYLTVSFENLLQCWPGVPVGGSTLKCEVNCCRRGYRRKPWPLLFDVRPQRPVTLNCGTDLGCLIFLRVEGELFFCSSPS
jgi:hypothetical protein